VHARRLLQLHAPAPHLQARPLPAAALQSETPAVCMAAAAPQILYYSRILWVPFIGLSVGILCGCLTPAGVCWRRGLRKDLFGRYKKRRDSRSRSRERDDRGRGRCGRC
jgi:hypothetical protein